MRLVSTRSEIRQILDSKAKSKIGFVPTMGALHEGHLSLVKRSMDSSDITVVSIFVNPAQFNSIDDLEKYPRTPEKDIELLSGQLGSEDILFMPEENEVYSNEKPLTVDLGSLDLVMEGMFRPGHFEGVVRVVSILFDIVQPGIAFFGEKDFQQLTIIKRMAEQTHPSIVIEGCPIHREQNGLAMSSRNSRLGSETREKASVIYQTLKEHSVIKAGSTIESVTGSVKARIDSTPGFRTEYFEIVDDVELKRLESTGNADAGRNYFGCIAVFAGEVRLIDNMRFSFPVSKG